MQKAAFQVLMPQYMQHFQCIGGSCEDTCCAGWEVPVDSSTLERYKGEKDPELKALLKQNVIEEAVSCPSPSFLGSGQRGRFSFSASALSGRGENAANAAGWINMGQKRRCPFLTPKGLCFLQLERGEDFLSDTCYTFPRVINEVEGVLEKSATVSCPEAARLILLNPLPMRFVLAGEAEGNGAGRAGQVKKRFAGSGFSLHSERGGAYGRVRRLAIAVLQDRRCRLEERLIFLGRFLYWLEELLAKGDRGELEKHLHKAEKNLRGNILEGFAGSFSESSFFDIRSARTETERGFWGGRLPFAGGFANPAAALDARQIQGRVLGELAGWHARGEITNLRYRGCLRWFLSGLHFGPKTRAEEAAERYRESEQRYYRPFLAAHGHIMEHYLVNYAFANLFPFDERTVSEAYVMLMLRYAVIKMQLAGIAAFHRRLLPETAVRFIQAFERTMECYPQWLRQMMDMLCVNGWDSLTGLAALISGEGDSLEGAA